MNLRVGYIPYLNMAPFHIGFGPECLRMGDEGHIDFLPMSPRALGLEAQKGAIDAGALSLADLLRLPDFERLGRFGIAMKGPAQSVLLFSDKPLSQFEGFCAVTDETSTSFRLLQVLLEKRYERTPRYGRVASSLLFDGSAQGLLLIGDEALRARREGVKALPHVTDLGQEWLDWQGTPFVFACWAVHRSLPEELKRFISGRLENSLKSIKNMKHDDLERIASRHGMSAVEAEAYWSGFHFQLTQAHERSIETFKKFAPDLCLSV